MIRFEYEIENPSGFHARPASMLVKEAMQYQSIIQFQKGESIVNCKSMMSVLAAGIKNGDCLVFIIEGEDEGEAEHGFKTFLETALKGV
mgnify:CR=1 FL=1